MAVLFFISFWRISILFSIVAAPIYIPTKNTCPHPPPYLLCLAFLITAYKHEVISYCGFDLHFPNNLWPWTSFHVLCIFFGKNVSSDPLPIFESGCLFFCCWVVWIICIFLDINPLSDKQFANIFSHSVGFHLFLQVENTIFIYLCGEGLWVLVLNIFLTFYFILEYSWFTTLC